MLEAFVIVGGIVVVLLAVGLVVDSKDIGRKTQPSARRGVRGRARRGNVRQVGEQGGYLFINQPWS